MPVIMIMVSVLWYKTLRIRPGTAVRVLTGAVMVMGRWRSCKSKVVTNFSKISVLRFYDR